MNRARDQEIKRLIIKNACKQQKGMPNGIVLEYTEQIMKPLIQMKHPSEYNVIGGSIG